jgi:hypothetical protein
MESLTQPCKHLDPVTMKPIRSLPFLLAGCVCAAITSALPAQPALIFHEDFEDDGEGVRYTVDGGGDNGGTAYFARRQVGSAGTVAEGGTLSGLWMWGASRINSTPGERPPPGTDLDVAEARINFNGIDVAGYGNFRLEMAVARGGGAQLVRNHFTIRIRFDDGPWFEIGGFKPASTNSSPRYFVGPADTLTTRDSPLLFAQFIDWSWDIVGSGSRMDMSITIHSNAANRQYYFDNVRLIGDAGLSFFNVAAANPGTTTQPLLEPVEGGIDNSLDIVFAEPTPAGGVTLNIGGTALTLHSVDFGASSFYIDAGVTQLTLPFAVVQDNRFTGRKNIDIHVGAVGYNTEVVRLIMENSTPKPRVLIMEIANGLPGTQPEHLVGDYNNDGQRQSAGDQFMELVNFEDFPVDISGWYAGDDIGPRHVFPEGTILQPLQPIVVFGGGTPLGSFGGAIVMITSNGGNGWGFNGSSEETAWLNAPFGGEVQSVRLWDYATNRAKTGGESSPIPTDHPAFGETATQHRLSPDPDIPWPDNSQTHSLIPGSGFAFASPGTWPDGSPYYDADNIIMLGIDATSIREDAGPEALTATIDLAFPAAAGGLAITLHTDGIEPIPTPGGYRPGKISLATHTILIPEGQTSATFNIGAHDNGVLDGDRLVTVEARAPNCVPGSVIFTVLDVAVDDLTVVLNEVMLDVVGTNADINLDGIVEDTVGDQFIEVVNASGRPVNLSGWYVEWITHDARGNLITSHVFPPGTWLAQHGSLVVFGRLDAAAAANPVFAGAIVQEAADSAGQQMINGLSFDPVRDQYIRLHNPHGYEVDMVSFLATAASQDMSLVRQPEITGPHDDLVLHLEAAINFGSFSVYSPGIRLDGTPFPGNATRFKTAAVFTEALIASNTGWFYDPWYGWVGVGATSSNWDIPWVYLRDIDAYWYIMEASVSAAGMWYYDAALAAWCHSSYASYPQVWNASAHAWINRRQ